MMQRCRVIRGNMHSGMDQQDLREYILDLHSCLPLPSFDEDGDYDPFEFLLAIEDDYGIIPDSPANIDLIVKEIRKCLSQGGRFTVIG